MLEGKRVLFFDDAWQRRCVPFMKYCPGAKIVRTIDQANDRATAAASSLPLTDKRYILVGSDQELSMRPDPEAVRNGSREAIQFNHESSHAKTRSTRCRGDARFPAGPSRQPTREAQREPSGPVQHPGQRAVAGVLSLDGIRTGGRRDH